VHILYLGPHAPRLTPKEIHLLHGIWLELSKEVAPLELHHCDIVHYALENVRYELANGRREEVIARMTEHLQTAQQNRLQ
jgi:hypothetical protein